MHDIGQGFFNLNAAVSQNPNLVLGLYACEVTVNFNIAATRNKDGKLAIGATIPLKVASVNGSYSSDSSFAVNRGNTVTVIMESAACLDRDVLVAEAGGSKTPAPTPTDTNKPGSNPAPAHAPAPAPGKTTGSTPTLPFPLTGGYAALMPPSPPNAAPVVPATTLPGQPGKLFFPLPPGYAASMVQPLNIKLPDGKIITLKPES
jgi:hypothetical protein